jgi:formate dehydrogenase major subunit
MSTSDSKEVEVTGIAEATKVKITIDGREILALADQTILEVCRDNSIHIPTLCYDDFLNPLGGCWICVVEVKGRGLVPSCATRVWPGMVVESENERVRAARKSRLEEFLAFHYGDCIAPCQIACPAGLDVQGYIALIARGQYSEAVTLIKESIPMPAVIGRICPHPCESACRRNLVDEPLAICSLKRFAADYDFLLSEGTLAPSLKPKSGFRVAIIGAGPAGLSAAFYLTRMGHDTEVFEALPQPGGMLRYGIPDYRLPKDVLDREIATIAELGVKIRTDRVLGKDFSLESLFNDGFHAVFVSVGAHKSQKINVEGEDMEGVLPGTDFLRSVAMGERMKPGKRIAVIGGGNTAIDAARTALRLGADEVTIVYRRSRTEMPASEWEVDEAEEEGVRLHFLAAPVSVIGENGRVGGLVCIKMALGEPDDSGRRRPERIPGTEFTLAIDTVIAAIGQTPEVKFLEAERVPHERGTLGIGKGDVIVANHETLQTDMKGVFAGGDAVTGAATAVEAMAAGRRAAGAIDRYLNGKELESVGQPFNLSKGELSELSKGEFADVERQPRREMPKLRPMERRDNFQEMELGYTEDIAKKEAERCMACGCKAADYCTLRQLAAEYEVPYPAIKPDRYIYPVDSSHPFIEIDANKCIACIRCIRTCIDVQNVGALNFCYRVAIPSHAQSLLDTNCESCGQCIASCPVGALVAKDRLPPLTEVSTICPYCGVGCGVLLGTIGNAIVSVRAEEQNPANRGRLCVKGRFGIPEFVNHPERLTTPLVRKNGRLAEATWEEALDLITSKLSQCKGEKFAAIASAKCTNEENYVIQKFTRAVMGTNNVDHCARLCHAPTVAGLAQSFGSGAMTNSIAEIGDASCIFAIGTNTTDDHPIIGMDIKKAVKNGAKLIVANPREIDLCRFATLWLRHRPGSDVALLMGMMKVIVDEGLLDSTFIEERCENFEEFRDSAKAFELSEVEKITGVSQDKIVEAARIYAQNSPASILYGMGITQHSHGTDNVIAVANLAMLTGNIGKPSSGVNPLRGQSNVQGACDMGALPNVYPGYQSVADRTIKEKFEGAWGAKLSDKVGLTLTEILDEAYKGNIKAVYLVGENPVLSDPDAKHVEDALEGLELFVVQDIFLTETANLADVVLPSASFAETDGTFTNTERRVQLGHRAIQPRGDSRPDWWITCQIARRLGGQGFDFESPSHIMEEIAEFTPSYGGISHERLEEGGLQWPCPIEDYPGTPILHTVLFTRGKGRFMPLEYKPPMEQPDDDYPLILTMERSLYQFHTGTMTRKVKGLNVIKGEELVQINPEDASKLGIDDGERIRVISRRGKVTAKSKVTEASPVGVVTMSFHFTETRTNLLTNPALDPVSKIPELKVCAVRVEKVNHEAG